LKDHWVDIIVTQKAGVEEKEGREKNPEKNDQQAWKI
jgi:hypothetical protein